MLLNIFKNGSTSTLDIVSGVKRMMEVLKPSLPDTLEIKPLADQSIFVRASIQDVVREGVIAAALTSLMILLFLGSWRSTLIVATSIPLSIFGAIASWSGSPAMWYRAAPMWPPRSGAWSRPTRAPCTCPLCCTSRAPPTTL